MDSIDCAAFYLCDFEASKGIVNQYDVKYFTDGTNAEKTMINDLKELRLSMTASILPNTSISSIDGYLLDSGDVKIRLELAYKSWHLNSPQDVRKKFALNSKWLSYVWIALCHIHLP